jgi:hypothetical protein
MYGQLKATVRTPEEAADSVIVLPTIYFTMIGPAIFLLSVILGAASTALLARRSTEDSDSHTIELHTRQICARG